MRYIASATVVVEHEGTRVLCDPWLTEGIYYGSWFHYPPLEVGPEDFSDVDYIYISHIHPDHMDVETLKRLPRCIPIVICDFGQKFVLRILTALGFANVVELPHGARYSLGREFDIAILAADNCDPAVCGRYFGCMPPTDGQRTHQIDSLAVFRGGERTLVNANDSPYPLARGACDRIQRDFGHVDLLLCGYAGAGPFPQCFEDFSREEKLERGAAKRDQFLRMATRYLDHLRPDHFMPFAGQYTLGGRLAELNELRGAPELEDVREAFGPHLERHDIASRMVLLNAGESFDLDTGGASAPFRPPDPAARRRFVAEQLAHKAYLYDQTGGGEEKVDLIPKLTEAHARMVRYQDAYGGYRSPWSFYFDAGQPWLYRIRFDGTPPTRSAPDELEEPYVRIALPYGLLDMILDRRAHFNNAEIGSHLRFRRSPDEFERALYHLICYLQCEADRPPTAASDPPTATGRASKPGPPPMATARTAR